MPRNCIYCGMYGQAGNSNLSLHQFPVDVSRRKSWFSALGTEYDDRRFIYLCCNHFSSNDFELSPTGLLRLKKTAIPCVAGFSATFLKVSISEDECSDLEPSLKSKMGQWVTNNQYDEMRKIGEITSSEDSVKPAIRICSEHITKSRITAKDYVQTLQVPQRQVPKGINKSKSQTSTSSKGNKYEFKGFSRDQQVQPIPSYSSGNVAITKENTEKCNIKRFIEVEHAYGISSNFSKNKIADETETGKSSNFSEIKIVDESETETADETDTAEETDIKTEQEDERDENTEQEEEIIIIHSVDDSCEDKNKKDKNRIGYNNPNWIRKKIENQLMQMKYFEKRNLDLRCKIIDMKVSLGFTRNNIRRSDDVKVEDAPVGEYPGFQEMLKQASIQQLDKDAAIRTIFRSVNELKLKRYDNAFKKWLQFCSENNVNIFEPEVSEVIDFFKALLAPGTMNYSGFVVYEKAILGILGDDKASYTRLKEFLEELNDLFNSFQQQNYTWDPHVLLLHLSKYFPNEYVGLAEVSRKVVTLLTLVTKVGIMSLKQLKLKNVAVTETEVQISFADYRTGTVCRSDNTTVKLPFFIETPQLCVASTLAYYIEQTSKIRGLNEESLFIEFKYPYNSASITTLNTWIRESMTSAGIEFAMFSDLVANLNSLKDHQNEVLFDEIKRRVRWTDDMLIFTHFYNL